MLSLLSRELGNSPQGRDWRSLLPAGNPDDIGLFLYLLAVDDLCDWENCGRKKAMVPSNQMVVNPAGQNVNISVRMDVMSQTASPEWLLTSNRLPFVQHWYAITANFLAKGRCLRIERGCWDMQGPGIPSTMHN